MRIAYYIWETFTAGGIQRITIDKLNYWAQVASEVILITSNQEGKPPFWQISDKVKQIDLGIDYQEVNKISKPWARFKALRAMRAEHKRRLSSVLQAHPVDICVNTVFCEEGTIFPELKDGSLKVLENHGVKYALLPKYERRGLVGLLGKVQDYFRRKRYEAMPRNYDHFVVLSASHLKQWEGYPNISAIQNMCVLPQGELSPLSNPKVITLARLSEEKGLDSLIRIWSLLADQVPEWSLEIWGDGTLKQYLEELIESLGLIGRVKLCGSTNDVASVYRSASIYCLSSRHEGFPMTLIEAQTCGLPIVSYACPLGPLDIVHHEKDGYLVPPGNESEFADKLLGLMTNDALRARMGREARLSSDAYTEEVIMQRWKDLFQTLLQTGRGRAYGG